MMFNPYVKQCPTMVRTALTSFYEGMPEGGPDTSRLSNLLTKVVPLAGFTGGCLFLISRKKGALVPGAIIGRVRAIEVDSVPLGSITRKSSSLDSASSANGNKSRSMIEQTFLSRRSMFERARPLGAKDPASILALIARFSATIGEKNPVGVLYLEKPLSDNPEDEADSLIAFRAINRTISDSLYIE
jgi:hypothetical protein